MISRLMVFRGAMPMAVVLSLFALTGCGSAVDADSPTSEAIGTRLATLEQDVQGLEDSKAIKRLQRAYGYYVDKGMGDRIAELFSSRPDASVEMEATSCDSAMPPKSREQTNRPSMTRSMASRVTAPLATCSTTT